MDIQISIIIIVKSSKLIKVSGIKKIKLKVYV